MQEVNWERIDKRKFFVNGIGMFSGVTCLLFPLTVIKTRQMANHEISGGFKGMTTTVRTIWQHEGIPGFYRGFATVVLGTIPARMMYLTSLEIVKDGVSKVGHKLELTQTVTAGIANGAGGAVASLSTQLVAVPIDVISQRQMVHGDERGQRQAAAAPQPAAAAPQQQKRAWSSVSAAHRASSSHTQSVQHSQQPCRQPAHTSTPLSTTAVSQTCRHRHGGYHMPGYVAGSAWHTRASSTASATLRGTHTSIGGLEVARLILREEGVKGFYRGFGMSVATFVPNSAMWWSAYGVYQQLVSSAYLSIRDSPASSGRQTSTNSSTSSAQAAAVALHSSTSGQQTSASGEALSSTEVLWLQVTSSVLAGLSASLITNPLDLIKTRIQVAVKNEGQAHSVRAVLSEVLREDGLAGLWRGALPRMVNSAMWGTAMVSVYEFLKRNSLRVDM